MEFGQGEPNGAECRFHLQKNCPASWCDRRQPARHLVSQPRHRFEYAACQDERERFAAQFEPIRDGCRRGDELVGAPIEDRGGDGVTFVACLLHMGCQRRRRGQD